MSENKEFLQTLSFTRIQFADANDAIRTYEALPQKVKMGMAQCYKAFEEEPWFDPPYDMDQLMNQDFPSMVASFVPGGLVIAKNRLGEVVGFASGGQTTAQELVRKKYSNETQEQQESIVEIGRASCRERV